ncbi:hypothetical protein E2E30_02595 [Sphingomonas sp. AAP5]|nr:hypothetical protein E2E30_02595 [Sphingomonas sp. AAP5]
MGEQCPALFRSCRGHDRPNAGPGVGRPVARSTPALGRPTPNPSFPGRGGEGGAARPIRRSRRSACLARSARRRRSTASSSGSIRH